jgi:glycine C-acetyltransferase
MKDLEAKLIESQDARVRLIATDGVFSMDGDVAPLDKIAELCEKYNANLFVDECHATGFYGKTGRGVPGELKNFLTILRIFWSPRKSRCH